MTAVPSPNPGIEAAQDMLHQSRRSTLPPLSPKTIAVIARDGTQTQRRTDGD